jgi:heterotetrameric sarcosine oxidase gamma subunit
LVTDVAEPIAAAIEPPERARSAITPDSAVAAVPATGGAPDSPVCIYDQSGLAKFGVRAAPDGSVARALGTGFARTTRAADGSLVVGSGPGEWLVLADPATASDVRTWLESATGSAGEFASVVDLTHGRALIRLAGARCGDLLAKVCGIDFSDDLTPSGSALRTSVARLVTDIVRDDQDGVPGYLLHCERSSGRYLFEALVDAGTEFGIESLR